MRLARRSVLLGAASLLARPALAEDRVFLTYSQSELDRAYDQAVWAPDRAALIAGYATESAAVRAAVKPKTVKYGSTDAESLDIFKPGIPGRLPVHVFIHGGAWASLSKDDASVAASSFVDSGAVYIALGFANIPQVRLADMIEQCRRAMGWIAANAASFGGNADAVHISGHSSGAHLAAVLATTDWAARGLPADLIKSTVLISGTYELYPVMLSSRRNYLKLSPEEVVAFSPLRHMSQWHGQAVVAAGDQESPEFKRQMNEMADVLAGMGALRLRTVLFNRNHFQMPAELARPEGPIGHMALTMMGLV